LINLRGVRTGVIPDLHIPGHVDGALEFCVETFRNHGVQQVVCLGDIVDHHFISRHQTEVDALNPEQEFKLAKKELQKWVKAFPDMFICQGNHDLIPERRLHELGVPSTVYLKSLNDVYGLPDTWVWSERFKVFDDVIIEHGIGSAGMYGARNTAIKLGCSYVQGHTHSFAGTYDIPRALKNNAAMNAGCLVDVDKYYSRYGRLIFKVPVSLGCGIIYSVNHMEFIPFR